MKIAVWNILDMVEEYGEDSVKEILSVFSCKKDREAGLLDLLNSRKSSFMNFKSRMSISFSSWLQSCKTP